MQKAVVQEQPTIALTVNGEQKQVRARTPRELLSELELDGEFFAIAVNRRVVTRAKWDATALQHGDTIEIVTPRQGG